MKEIILLTCLAAIASAIPRPERPQVAVPFIPEEFRRAAIPEEIFAPQAENLNLNDAPAPNAISINFVHVDPQQTLQDFIELIKIAQQAFEAQPEEIKISPFPINLANIQPIKIVDEVPADNQASPDADKVVVVDAPEVDKVQVEYLQPEPNVIAEESNVNEVDKVKVMDAPIQEEQNEAVRVASLPIQNSENEIAADVDKFWGVKFVESPNSVSENEAFVGVPSLIAPSELDSLRVDFNDNPAPISLGDAKEPRPFYPNLYDDPMLR